MTEDEKKLEERKVKALEKNCKFIRCDSYLG